MRAVAHGWSKPGGGGPSVSVAKKFMHADERRKPGKRTREQRADHKREMDKWAEGK
jgi:hypothetical protein